MGKISFKLEGAGMILHAIGNAYNGIEFDKIQQVVNSLPGRTSVVKIEELVNYNSLSRMWQVDAENLNFLDGTEIFIKYKRIIQRNPANINGFTSIDLFDGVDIIDPPAQAQASNQSTTQINPALTPPSAPPPGFQFAMGGNGTITAPLGSSVTMVGGGASTPNNTKTFVIEGDLKCTCGATKCGGLHSNWCDIK
jgi:hypothetical protein